MAGSTKQALSLDSLKNLDHGRVGLAFSEEVRRVVEDINDRPALNKARTITLTLEVTPETDDSGDINAAVVQWHLKHTIPPRKTMPYSMLPTKNGQLFFQPDSPEDPRQEGIDFETGEVKGEGKK
jgi:hypothetical protein